MAAEMPTCRTPRPARPSFNEAAANGRGNAVLRPRHHAGADASMRPRRMAAEMRGRPLPIPVVSTLQ